MKEEWRTIPTFEKYEASNFGRVRNKRTKQILSPNTNKKGYRHVFLFRKNKRDRHTIGVHRAVALAWIPTEDFSMTVNHKDENKNNNCVENLEWLSNLDNVRYSQGKKVICKETGVIYESISKAAKETGISFATIKRSCESNYERTKRIKYTFEYFEVTKSENKFVCRTCT